VKELKRMRKSSNEKDNEIEGLKTELELLQEELKYGNNTSILSKFGTNPFTAGMKFFNTNMAERYTTGEWSDIMKFTNLTLQQIQQLSRDPLFTIILDSLELMNRAVMDKNSHIKILQLENENLNKKNTSLIEENIGLSKKIVQQRLDITKDQSSTALHTNASMV
jgi:hypothetical protein